MIKAVRSPALLVRSVPYGESDLIATFFTKEAGLLGAIVRNYDDAGTLGRVFNTQDLHNSGRLRLDKVTGVLTLYEDDLVTPRLTFQLRDSNGDPSSAQQYEREPT